MREDLPSIIIVGGGLAGVFCALKLAPTPVAVFAPTPIGISGLLGAGRHRRRRRGRRHA
jgi:L-aspartate oxidase